MKFRQENDSVSREITTNRRNRKPFFQLLLSAILLMTLPIAMGADFWEKKEYKEWKDRDCIKMLTDSPWAKKYEVASGSNADDTLDGMIPFIRYTARFNSALPVRQATIRMAQINNKYDDLPDEQKQAFDQSANQYLATAFNDVVVIQVEYATNRRTQQIPLANHWQTQTTEHLKNTTYLYGGKDIKVQLLEYIPPQGASTTFQFIFPRMYEGQPIVSAEDKSMRLEFDIMGGDQAHVDYKVKDMLLDGEVNF